MIEFLKRRSKDFMSDKVQWGTSLLNAVMLGCMAYFYTDSGRMVEPMLYLGFFFFYIITTFFSGRKALPFLYLIYSAGAVQDITFINCTVFLMLLGATEVLPRVRLPALFVYAGEIFLVCYRHSKSVWHLLAHFALCGVLYIGYTLVARNIRERAYRELSSNKKRLELTEDERSVVSQLASGKMMKEVEGYSKNTKSKHLRTAMERNGCSTKEEMLALYSIWESTGT